MGKRPTKEIARRRNRHGAALSVIMLATLFVVPGAGQTQSTPAARQAKPVETPTALQRLRKQAAFGRMIHFRERGHARTFGRIRAALRNEEFLSGLRRLQQLIDATDDRFIFMPGRDSPIGFRRAAEQLLAELNRKGRDTYEQLYGATAAQRLREADALVDIAGYRDVLKRYFHTKAGFFAADRLARIDFDRGEFAAAAAVWLRLSRDRYHRVRVTGRMKLMLAVASHKAGDPQRSAALLRQIGRTPFQIAGRKIAPDDWFQQRTARSAKSHSPDDWRMPLGNAGRNRSVSVAAPFPRALWTKSFVSKRDDRIEKVFRNWEQQQAASVAPKAVANTAIVVGDRVIVRDFDGIHALNLADGKRRWSFQPITTLAKSISRSPAAAQSTREEINPFSGRRARSGYDLQTAYANNSTLGTLTSDGRLVFAIDDFKLNSSVPSSSRRFGFAPPTAAVDRSQRTNRLVALRIRDAHGKPQATRKPVWTVGTVPGTGKEPTALSNHFFLGPPLPVGRRLYAVTESKQRLHLVCLSAVDGRLFWMQKIALAENSIAGDINRAVRSCMPSYADGVVVCPTQTGLLIGVDAETGSLRWASFCGDDRERMSRRPAVPIVMGPEGRSGFWSAPRIVNRRVIFLPRGLSHLHCVDLSTGESLWRAPRGDGEYIAAVTKNRIVVVGRRHTRGLSVGDGTEMWSVALGMPSGRGLQLKGRVLVPLEAGHIVTLDIDTGKTVGQTIPRPQLTNAATPKAEHAQPETPNVRWRPGNLIAAGGMILSSEARQLQAFLPATTVLARAESELRRSPKSLAKRIEVAEVQLLLGRLLVAERHLEEVLKSSKAEAEQGRAKNMLRELLYARLVDEPDDSPRILDRIKDLSATPRQQGRYLVRRADFELRRGNFDGVLRATQQFTALDLKRLFPMPRDETHLVSAASWVPSVIGRIRGRFGPAALKTVAARIDTAGQRALASSGTQQLERFLAVYRDWPQAASIRAELATRSIARGRYQHAEFLLMTNRSNSSRRIRAVATAGLAQLWIKRGLHDRAAVLLEELAGRYADTILTDGSTTGRRFSNRFSPGHAASRALRRRKGPKRPFNRVTISSRLWMGSDPRLATTLGAYRQRFLTPFDSPFDLLDRGQTLDRKLAVIDKATAIEVGSISIPVRHSYPMLSRNAHIGHFFALGGAGDVYGVSLLEHDRGKPLWKTVPQGFDARTDLLNVGPAGPTFCSFQARGSLVVVDPATGRLLWQRNGLDPKAGAISDPYSGLFGDERALVLFAADRKGYTVYDTQTGAELRQGQLDISGDHVRRMFGRRLAYVKRDGKQSRFRIWDPIGDRRLLDVPFVGPLHSTTTDQGELVVMLPENRLLVYDVKRGATVIDVRLDPEETANLTYLRAFRQGNRVFVNLQRVARAPRNRFSFYASNAFVAAEHVRGDVHAFDVKTGRRLWSREVPQRSILKLGLPNLPYLVFVSQIRERNNRVIVTMRVEAVDTETGETLGKSENIFPDRIQHVVVSPDHSHVELRGEKSTIRIDAFNDRPPGSPF